MNAREAIARARNAAASPSEGLERAMELFQQPGPIDDFRALVQELKRLVATSDVSTMDAFLHLAAVVPHLACKLRAQDVGKVLGCWALALGDCRTTATAVCTLVGAILTSPLTAAGFASAFVLEWSDKTLSLADKHHAWVRTCYRPLVQPIITSAPLKSAQEFTEAWTFLARMLASSNDKSMAIDVARTALDAFCDPRTNAEARGSMAGSMYELLQRLDAADAQRVAAIIAEETLLHASPTARIDLLWLLKRLAQDAAATPEHFVMVCHVFATATGPDEQPIWLALLHEWIEVAAKDTSRDVVLSAAYLIPPVLQLHAVASTASIATAALLYVATKYAYYHRRGTHRGTANAITIVPNEAGVLTLRCHVFACHDVLETLPAPSGACDVSAVLTAASALVAFGWALSNDLVAYLDACAKLWPEARQIVTPCFLYVASTRQHPAVLATLLNIPGTNQCTYCSETHPHVLGDCSVLKTDIGEKKPLRKGVVVPPTFNCSYCRYHELLEATGHGAPASTRRLLSPKFHREHKCEALLNDIANSCVRVGYVYVTGTGPPKGWVNYLAGRLVDETSMRKQRPGKHQRARAKLLSSITETNLDAPSEPSAKRRHTEKTDNSSSHADPTGINMAGNTSNQKRRRRNRIRPKAHLASNIEINLGASSEPRAERQAAHMTTADDSS